MTLCLTEQQFTNYVNSILTYASECNIEATREGVTRLVTEWDKRSYNMFQAMGGKLKWSGVTTGEVDRDQLNSFTRTFYGAELDPSSPFAFNRDTDEGYASCFIYNLYWTNSLQDCLNTGVISQDALNSHSMGEKLKEAGIKKGMKLSKAYIKCLQKDAQLEKDPTLRGHLMAQVDSHSQRFSILLQEVANAKREDVVYLSNDLMDWIRMSDFSTGSSCHAWSNEHDSIGMFAMGTLSYALQESCLLAYTLDDNGLKSWRQVVYCDLESGHAVGSRQYPNNNDAYATKARHLWQDLSFGTTDGFKFKRNMETGWGAWSDFLDYGDVEFAYIDLLKGAGRPSAWQTWRKDGERPQITCNADAIPCIKCGLMFEDREDNQLLCEDCQTDRGYCDHCEEHVDEDPDDMTYVEGVGRVCSSCLDDDFHYCDDCGEWHRDHDTRWVESRDSYICDDCIEDYTYCDHCNEYFHSDDTRFLQGHGRSYDKDVCDDCYESLVDNGQAICCEDCGEYYYDKDGFTSEYCDDCRPDHEDEDDNEDTEEVADIDFPVGTIGWIVNDEHFAGSVNVGDEFEITGVSDCGYDIIVRTESGTIAQSISKTWAKRKIVIMKGQVLKVNKRGYSVRDNCYSWNENLRQGDELIVDTMYFGHGEVMRFIIPEDVATKRDICMEHQSQPIKYINKTFI